MRGKLFAYLAVVVLCLGAVAFVPEANAEYPEKAIEFAVHSPAGGGSDTFGRAVAHILEKEGIVKQRIRVVNRPGGSGTTCCDYMASKKGDPYVISPLVAIGSVVRKISVLRYEDMTLLAMLIMDPDVIIANYAAPYNNMKELIAHFKKSGKEVNVGIGSVGGSQHLGAYKTGRATGLKLNIISFKGSGGSAVAILGGHCDIRIGSYLETLNPKAKQAKIIATMGEKRDSHFPDVLTLKEQGIDVTSTLIRGFYGPPDFPPYALKYWEDAFEKLVKTKAFKEYNDKGVGIITFMKGKELKTFMDQYVADMKSGYEALGLPFEDKAKMK
ncbi:MAG: tripartite tricarboxylate transporter substrate binding protein [Desulfobacterales bacterium]|nr:tripartite tricarboxylate transporter substrate binding protein [Desulfobacterales bacterium]